MLDVFWDRLPAWTVNQCEHLLINGMGKALLGADLNSLIFTPEEQLCLVIAMQTAAEEKLKDAAKRLCLMLDLKDDDSRQYVGGVVSMLTMWTGETGSSVGNLFL